VLNINVGILDRGPQGEVKVATLLAHWIEDATIQCRYSFVLPRFWQSTPIQGKDSKFLCRSEQQVSHSVGGLGVQETAFGMPKCVDVIRKLRRKGCCMIL